MSSYVMPQPCSDGFLILYFFNNVCSVEYFIKAYNYMPEVDIIIQQAHDNSKKYLTVLT